MGCVVSHGCSAGSGGIQTGEKRTQGKLDTFAGRYTVETPSSCQLPELVFPVVTADFPEQVFPLSTCCRGLLRRSLLAITEQPMHK